MAERLRPRVSRANAGSGVDSLLLATYFGGVGDNRGAACALPVQACTSMVCARRGSSTAARRLLPADKVLSVGIIDGRNIWRTDLERRSRALEPAACGSSASGCGWRRRARCCMCPFARARDRARPRSAQPGWRSRVEKLDELATLARGLNEGRCGNASDELAASAAREAQPRFLQPRVTMTTCSGTSPS